MKKSAVEWLIDKLFQLDNLTPNQLEILEQAKEMEKEQLIDCGNSCALLQHIHNDKVSKMSLEELVDYSKEDIITCGEQYYNQTFELH